MAEHKRPAPHAAGKAPPQTTPPPPAKKKLSPEQILKTQGFLAASAASIERDKHNKIVHDAQVKADALAKARRNWKPPKIDNFTDYRKYKESDFHPPGWVKPPPVHRGFLASAAHGLEMGMPFGSTGSPIYSETGNKFFKGAADAAVYLPSGLYQFRHPVKAGREVGTQLYHQGGRLIHHPIREWQNDPFSTATLGLAALSGGASVLGRVGAASAKLGEEAGAMAALKAAAKRPGGGQRDIYNAAGEMTQALNFRSPLGPFIGAAGDRLLGLHKPGELGQLDLRRPLAGLREKKFNTERIINTRHQQNLHPQELSTRGASVPWLRNTTASINRLTRMGMLFAKPFAYLLGNLPGQEYLSLMGQGLRTPQNRAIASILRSGGKDPTAGGKTGWMKHGTYIGKGLGRFSDLKAMAPENLRSFEGAAGTGRVVGSMPEPRAGKAAWLNRVTSNIDQRIGGGLGKVLDDPYRLAALVGELRRLGVKPPDIEALIVQARQYLPDKPHDPNVPKQLFDVNSPEVTKASRIMTEASRRANNQMIDYGRLNAAERWIRDIILFYPWVKGASMYTMRFPFEHPNWTAAQNQIGQYGKQHTGLPIDQPSIVQGSFKTGERNVPGLGKVPMVANWRNAGIHTQLFDTARAGLSLIPHSGVSPSVYTGFEDELVPFWSGIIKGGGPHKGFDTTEAFKQGILQPMAPYQLAQRLLHPASEDPTNRLYPRNRSDAWKAWALSSAWSKPLNPVRAQKDFRTENQTGKTPQQKHASAAKWLQEDVLKKIQLSNPGVRNLPPHLVLGALNIQKHADMRTAALKQYNTQLRDPANHHRLSKRGEFIAAVWSVVPDGPNAAAQRKALAEHFLAIPDAAYADTLANRKKTGLVPPSQRQKKDYPQFDNQQFQSIYDIRQYLADLNKRSKHLPYAQGGAPVMVPKA